MKEKGIILGLSLLFIVIAFFIRDWFLSFSTALIMDEKLFFIESWKLPYQIFPTLIFMISFGLIPFIYLFVKKRCHLISIDRKLISIVIIISSGLLFYTLRVMFLKFKASQINDLLRRAEFATEADIPRMRFDEMYLEPFLLAGFLVGSVFCCMIYKKKLKLK